MDESAWEVKENCINEQWEKIMKKKIYILILLSLIVLSACGNTNCRLNTKNPSNKLEEETATMIESVKELPKKEVWSDKIYVTEQQPQGNILGYSLKRNQVLNMWYEKDLPYLLDEASVGRGIYISEYMCETEVFLGSILKDMLVRRGKVNSEQKQYFTDWALEQLALTGWDLLDEQWKPDLYAYDRNYKLHYILGESNYSFSYVFYTDEKEKIPEEVNYVDIRCSVNPEGKIYEIKISINKVPAENSGMEKTVNMAGLFDAAIDEIVICDGNIYSGKILLDFEKYFERFLYPDEVYEQSYDGLLVSGDAALSAERIGKIFSDVLKTQGENTGQYADWFAYESSFSEFENNSWDWLEENWTANGEYDCVYIDNISMGYVGFQYYFYPDYDMMNTDVAKAVTINCDVDVVTGKLTYTDIRLFPMTWQEYQTIKERNEKESWNIAVVERGQMMIGKENVVLPIPQNELYYMSIKEFNPRVYSKDNYVRKNKYELWGYSDLAEVAAYLGEVFLQDVENETIEKGSLAKLLTEKADSSCLYSIAECAEKWNIDKEYDCFYIRGNECAGSIHLKYYFYLQKINENYGNKNMMVIDLYVSDLGVEYIQVNNFQTNF